MQVTLRANDINMGCRDDFICSVCIFMTQIFYLYLFTLFYYSYCFEIYFYRYSIYAKRENFLQKQVMALIDFLFLLIYESNNF